ncbi:MAG: response regulator [Chitinispirillaceae bacterium]|nr:response regulator [Chitinispirillaceae bacterium]
MFNILVIDDNQELRDSLGKCLLRLGCDVVTAESAEVGIEKIKQAHFDAVFASLCLRSMSGRGIARWVSEHNGRDIKFFITTSWKGELEKELFHFDGIHDVVRIPYSFSEVRDKILEHLG